MSRRIFGDCLAGSGGSSLDPGGQLCDLFGRQSRAVLRGWHPIVVVRGDSFQDETLAGRSGDVTRPALTALPNKTRRVQPQSTFLFAWAVARKALVAQQRLDFRQVVDALSRRLFRFRFTLSTSRLRCKYPGKNKQHTDKQSFHGSTWWS